MGAVHRKGRGRPWLRPRWLLADRGYSNCKARRACRKHNITLVTPPKSNHKRKVPCNKERYRQRNQIERLINRIKRCRRVATRYEKRACFFGAMLYLAFILEWL